MARGIIIGVAAKTEDDKDGVPGAIALLGGIRGADVAGGPMITARVPLRKEGAGPTESRVAREFGVFTIPFTWDPAVDWARANGVPVMRVVVSVWPDAARQDAKRKFCFGPAGLILDVPRLLNTVKQGTAIQSDSIKSVLKNLTKEMKKAISEKDFESVHKSMLSTEQHAIVGVVGCVFN